MFCLAKSTNLLFSEDDCHPSFYSLANSGRRLTFTGHIKASCGNLAAVVFKSNKFISLRVISLVSCLGLFGCEKKSIVCCYYLINNLFLK